jgi:hypothetical protein
MVDGGDFVVKKVWIGFVQIDALLDDALVFIPQWLLARSIGSTRAAYE